MASRHKLHEELCEILGSRNVYFQPPASVKMQYPGIKYSFTGVAPKRANNRMYSSINRYEIILIEYDPDSDIGGNILSRFSMCNFERSYAADNLNHKVYTIYY